LSKRSRFIFLQLYDVSQTNDHPQEDLAKFGYRKDVKVKHFSGPFYILATCWNLLLQKFGNFYFFQIWHICAIHFTKILYMYGNYIFQLKKMQKKFLSKEGKKNSKKKASANIQTQICVYLKP